MKFILFTLLLISQAHASSTLLLLALAAGEEESKTEAPLSPVELELRELRRNLPSCSGSAWNGCWGEFNQKSIVKKVSQNNANQILSMLVNQGYSVKLREDELIFDFTKENKMYIEHQEKPISSENILFLSIFLTLLSIVYKVYLDFRKKVKKVKATFKEEDLFWSHTVDKEELKQNLLKNTIPAGWSFRWNEAGKIVGIHKTTSYGGCSHVASHRDLFLQSFNR